MCLKVMGEMGEMGPKDCATSESCPAGWMGGCSDVVVIVLVGDHFLTDRPQQGRRRR